jgi:K+-transporting ATPase ATPase A chain
MPDTTAGLLQVGLLIAALAVCYRPLGAYLARVYESEHDTRAERIAYRVMGWTRRPINGGRRTRAPCWHSPR